jgi:ABC-type lipoprotein release transport system permease subunit
VALGLLAGITAGVALAALAGARRTDAALDRLREETDAADAIVFASQAGNFFPNWDALEAKPEVGELAPWALLFGDLDGEPGEVLFAPVDGRWGDRVNRSVVTEGRMYDPEAPDEAVVDEGAARQEGVEIGDVIPFHAYSPDQDFDGSAAEGPQVDLRVVGLTRNVGQFLFTEGILMASPGLMARYGDEMAVAQNADLRLAPSGDIDALRRHVNEIVAPGTPVLDLNAVSRRVDTTTSVEHTALLLLSAVVAVAGLVLVGQALGRSASLVGDDAPALRAMGFTRTSIGVAAVLAHTGVAVLAAVVAGLTAFVASQWFPVGLARRIDPDVGLHVDWLVVGPGMVVTAVLVLLGAALVGARSAVDRPVGLRHRLGVAAWVRRVAPVTVGLGTTMAFEREQRRGSVAVAPALLAAVVGVLGVVGTIQIDQGLDDALDHPERAGVTWDSTVSPLDPDVTDTGLAPDLTDQVVGAPDVVDTAVIDRALVDVDGTGIPTFAVRPPEGAAGTAITLAVTDGRGPRAPGEAAIGPHTAEQLGVVVGDEVRLGEEDEPVRVVGEALFPSDVHSEFDEGLWITQPDLLAAAPKPEAGDFESAIGRAVAVDFRSGADVEAATAHLGELLGDRVADVSTAEVPPELTNLKNVRTLPVVLAIFLAVLAVAALSHVLLTSARRRRRDFAVLRALGMTRRGGRVVLNSQGTAIGLVGLLVGVPLGIAAGRTGWDWVAESVPLQAVAPFAAGAVVLLVPVALVLANAVALWPGRRVARLRPAQVLRSE